VLSGLLDVRRGEGRLVLPVAALGFVVVSAQVLAVIASDAIFVTTFTLGQLSGFIALASIFRVVLIFGYGAFARRQSSRAAAVLLVLVGAFTAVLGAVVGLRTAAVVYGVCIALLLVPVAAAEAVSEATETFPARQGKRLVPLVGACSTAGGLAGGATAGVLAHRLGVPSLLGLSGGLLALGGLLSAILPERGAPLAPRPRASHEPSRLRLGRSMAALAGDWRELPIVRVAVGIALLVGAANSLVDYLYKATLKASFAQAEMASYQGRVEAVLSACVIMAQLFLTAKLASRLGIRGALRLYPAAVAVAGPAFALSPGVASATGAKLLESVFRFSVVTPLRPSLLAPVEPRARARASLLARGGAAPLGGAVVGVVLAAFGAAGPPPWALGALLVGIAALVTAVLAGAGRAHATALARALGEGRLTFDVPPTTASALASGLKDLLRGALLGGDSKRAARVIALMGKGQLSFDDLAVAARSESAELRAAAARAAIRMADDGGAARLLALAPPSDDDAVERELLSAARRLGTLDRARAERALARTEGAEHGLSMELRVEALLSLVALGDVVARERLTALATALLGQVLRGPNFGPAARALTRMGEEVAMEPLLAALTPAPSSRDVDAMPVVESGAVRAARVLARLGPHACMRALACYTDLGYRAREAVAEALASMPARWCEAIPNASVESAVTVTLADAEALATTGAAATGLFARERRLRIARAARRVLDLASILGDRSRIAKARAALARTDRARADALELLEHVLPKAFARRTVALLESEGRPGPEDDESPSLDPWLQTCRRYDRGELGSARMIALLDKLMVLGESSLFEGMTSEELHPIGEIAVTVDLEPGDVVVRQGDPGDAVFVIADGTLAVTKDGHKLKEVGRGAVFGEMALLDGGQRSASIEALTRSRLLRIPRDEFEALIDQHPEIARGIIRTLLAHLRGSG
jgi:hypothetical protein